MSAFTHVHHVNFLYRDLDAAVARFEKLGFGPFLREDLDERGVRTARVQIGPTWFVLVSPTRPDSVPGRHLARHGEGFFLISVGVDDLDRAMADIEAGGCPVGPPRRGLAGWRVADLTGERTQGLALQLTEDPEGFSGMIRGPRR